MLKFTTTGGQIGPSLNGMINGPFQFLCFSCVYTQILGWFPGCFTFSSHSQMTRIKEVVVSIAKRISFSFPFQQILDNEHEKKMIENQKASEERTAKKRAKR